MSSGKHGRRSDIRPDLSIEDHGTEFYVVSRGEGHDLTLSLDSTVAEALAHFILDRLGQRPAGFSKDPGRDEER